MDLKTWRKSQRLNQTQLAKMLGVSQPRVSEIENGEMPGTQLIRKIQLVSNGEVPPGVWFESHGGADHASRNAKQPASKASPRPCGEHHTNGVSQ